jgi:hypothetical protein
VYALREHEVFRNGLLLYASLGLAPATHGARSHIGHEASNPRIVGQDIPDATLSLRPADRSPEY